MPEVEQLLRTAAPPATPVPPELEDRIWAALGHETETEPVTFTAFDGPELIIDAAPRPRRHSRFGRVLGVAAVAAALIGAVLLAGTSLRGEGPASPPQPATPAPGHLYDDGTCPDPARGACFEPFPAGRYTFHKSDPQVTLTVPGGWRNEEAWPGSTWLRRPAEPGSSLMFLTGAYGVRDGCDGRPLVREPNSAAWLTTRVHYQAGLDSGPPSAARVGELRGYAIDVWPTAAAAAACPDGLPLLSAPGNDGVPNGRDWTLTLRAGERARLLIVDSSIGRTLVLAAVTTGGQPELEAWVAATRDVVDSITFAPCARGVTFAQYCEPVTP